MKSSEINFKIAICDDETIFLENIKKLTKQYFNSKGIAIEIQCYQDPEIFLESDLHSYHIIFLDMNMGEKNGIEIAHIIRQKNKTVPIIFISAYAEFAVHGYSVKAFNYLLKNDLNKTFHIVMDSLLDEMKLQFETLDLKVENAKQTIKLEDVIYIESFKRYVIIHTQKEEYKQYGKISDFEAQLKEKGFLRIYKSFLININHVEKIENRKAYLSDGNVLTCSKERYSEIQHKHLMWKGR